MLGRLFSKLFGRRTPSRPVSPPVASPPPPPPPPPPRASASEPMLPVAPAGSDPGSGEGAGRVGIILEDGTLAKPTLDPELEERLRYIVDNIVPPSDPSSA